MKSSRRAAAKSIRRIFLLDVIVLGAVALLVFGRAVPSLLADVTPNDSIYRALPLPHDQFLRQSLNNCAPYTAAAVVALVRGQPLDPEQLAQETTWRVRNGLTLPQGLLRLLHRYGVRTREFRLYLRSDAEKVAWLKNTLDSGCPVVLLVKVEHAQHYVTVLGYDQHGFLLYDSMQERLSSTSRFTRVDRPEYEGNRYYTNAELLALWNAGGVWCFFCTWAAVCSRA